MSDPSLGTWLRKERERREITLKAISDQTKVSVPLLEGLEADNLSRWPDGIYRRAFVQSYATAVGLDPDEVCRRFEQEHGKAAEAVEAGLAPATTEAAQVMPAESAGPAARRFQSSLTPPRRARIIGTAADLTVALVLAMGSAAAGSRLLWPVLLIAVYYAVGIVVTGTSPMVALLQDQPAAPPQPDSQSKDEQAAPRMVERRHQPRRNNTQRPQRPARTTRPRVQ